MQCDSRNTFTKHFFTASGLVVILYCKINLLKNEEKSEKEPNDFYSFRVKIMYMDGV